MNFYNSFINKIFHVPEKLIFCWRIINPVIVLILISCLTLKYTNSDLSFFASTYIKQLIWISIGFMVLMVVQWLRVQFLNEYAYHFYMILLLMIIVTYSMPIIGGSRSWILIGSLPFNHLKSVSYFWCLLWHDSFQIIKGK